MAISTASNPFYVDATGIILASATQVTITKIRWASTTAAGDVCRIEDHNGRLFWQACASGARHVESDDFSTHRQQGARPNRLLGIRIATITSGFVQIYTE